MENHAVLAGALVAWALLSGHSNEERLGAMKYYIFIEKIVKHFFKIKSKLIYIMASAWITHVKQYAKTNKISYKDALKRAVSTYKKVK